MRRKTTVIMAAFSIFVMANCQAMAASYDLNLEEDMAEGMTLAPPTKSKSTIYKYDNSIPGPEELMGEGIVFAQEQKDEKHYIGDPCMPSMHDLIGEGICLEEKAGLITMN